MLAQCEIIIIIISTTYGTFWVNVQYLVNVNYDQLAQLESKLRWVSRVLLKGKEHFELSTVKVQQIAKNSSKLLAFLKTQKFYIPKSCATNYFKFCKASCFTWISKVLYPKEMCLHKVGHFISRNYIATTYIHYACMIHNPII